MDVRIGSWSLKRVAETYTPLSRRRSLLLALFVTATLVAAVPVHGQQANAGPAPAATEGGTGSQREQLLQRVNAAGTIRESRAMLEELVQSTEDSQTRQRAHELIAELAELSGEYGVAQRHYRLAWDARPDSRRLDLLLASALLRLELGELGTALEEADSVIAQAGDDVSLQTDARLLRTRILLAQAETEQATAELNAQRQSVTTDGSASQVFLLYELSRSVGDTQSAADAGMALRDRYPDSVEYALIRQDLEPPQRRVQRYPSPAQLFSSHAPGDESPLPAVALPADGAGPTEPQSPVTGTPAVSVLRDASSSEARTVRAIQAGAFRDPENATYMARDISNSGFPAEVRERSDGDAAVYVVLVPMDAGTTRDSALERMTALKEAGIEGFLIYD